MVVGILSVRPCKPSRRGDLLRKTIIVTTYYCLAAGTLALLAIHGLGLNLATAMLALLLAGLVLLTRWILKREPRLAEPRPRAPDPTDAAHRRAAHPCGRTRPSARGKMNR